MSNREYPVEVMLDRYGFYRQKYVMMKSEFTMHVGNAYTAKQMWEHLNGNMSLCVFAGPSNTSFLSIDIDMRSADVVHKVIDTMVDLGFPRDRIYVSDSGGKGYHVDVYFMQSIYNWMARQIYDLIIYFGELDKRKVEFRPTASQAIKVPLGVHQKTKRRCWFVDRETLVPIESFDYIESTQKIEPWRIDQIIKEGNKRRFYILLDDIQRVQHGKKSKSVYGEEISIDETGTRQRCMIEEALRLYRAGGDYNSIHADLTTWLGRQDPSMYKDSWQECMRNIDSITGWVMRCGRRRELGDDPKHEYHDNMRVYRSDIVRIIEAPTKTARMLAFLITVFCDKYEFCGLGEKKLCEILSVSSKLTIIKASNALVDRQMFYKKKGGVYYTGNSLKPVTNKYKFPKDYVRSGEYIEIDGLVTTENIYNLYIHTMAALCTDDELKTHLTKPELADVRKARETGHEES